MVLDFSSDIAQRVSYNFPHPSFSRLRGLNSKHGSLLKLLLPDSIKNSSVLIMDTNFTSPLRGIDITRYLLEERIGSTEEREVAKYILKATYGEVKSVFESVKSGKIIAPPHI